MNNPILRDQLTAALKQNKIKIKYPEGYKQWKEKFNYWYGITKDVKQTLDIMYGPNGGVDNYKGSLYTNANIKLNKKKEHRQEPKKVGMSSLFGAKKK